MKLPLHRTAVVVALIMQGCVTSAEESVKAPIEITQEALKPQRTATEPAIDSSWAFSEAATCAEAKRYSAQLNYFTLILAAGQCARESNRFDVTFLLLAAQIRINTDSELLYPITDDDKAEKAALISHRHLYADGSGADELYRDPPRTQDLFSELAAWRPKVFDGYNPGWNYKRQPKREDFEETYKRNIHNRIERLRQFAGLNADDEYYKARKASEALIRKNNGRILSGTPDHQEYSVHRKSMSEAKKRLNLPQPNLKAPPTVRIDPDADYRQIFTGTNGPETGGHTFILSKSYFEKTWLDTALSPSDKAKVFSEIDFETEILVVIAIGKQQRATGSLVVTRLNLSEKYQGFSYAIAVGIMEKGCNLEQVTSFPFALAVVKRPENFFEIQKLGNARGGFVDGCKVPNAGKPNEWRTKAS